MGEETCVCVWSLPHINSPDEQLALVLRIPIEVPAGQLPHLTEGEQPAARPNYGKDFLSVRVTLLRRPLSRWAGCQGSTKRPKCPRGCLFAAATVSEKCEVAGVGAGLLLEWSLGERAVLTGAQVAHDTPIVSLSY